MTKLLTILTMIIMISSCVTPAKKLNKINETHPADAAKFCNDKYPCVTKLSDTVTKVEYDFVEVACPGQDTITQKDTLFIPMKSKPKTYILTKTKFIASPVITKEIISVIKDSAEIAGYKYIIDNRDRENKKLLYKIDRKNNLIFWLIVSLCASLFLNFLNFISKK